VDGARRARRQPGAAELVARVRREPAECSDLFTTRCGVPRCRSRFISRAVSRAIIAANAWAESTLPESRLQKAARKPARESGFMRRRWEKSKARGRSRWR